MCWKDVQYFIEPVDIWEVFGYFGEALNFERDFGYFKENLKVFEFLKTLRLSNLGIYFILWY